MFRLARARSRLGKAYKLLDEGIEDEAGEDAWRACMDVINALVTALWGYEARSHYGISKLVDKLRELGIVDITTEYGNVSSLHGNYYDPHFGKVTIESNIRQVERLVNKVEEAIRKYVEPEVTLKPALIHKQIIKMLTPKLLTFKTLHPGIKVGITCESTRLGMPQQIFIPHRR